MTDSVIPLRFDVQQVGKHVKSSKKRFTWQISLNGKHHSIVLDFSFISGKVKVTVNRKVLLQNQLPANTSFQYPFTLDGNSLNVIQQGQSFELRINNKVFSHLYNQAKTNKQFKKYQDQVKDFKVNQNQFQAKKLTLNIGGTSNAMKKKPKNQSNQGHSWNAFGGQDQLSGFPNYFQGQSVSTTSSSKVQQSYKQTSNLSNNLLQQSSIQTKKSTQNILDFEQQLQKAPVVQQTQPTKAAEQFSTMQLMFQTMNINPQKPSVVIDSQEVDFFSSQQQTNKSNITTNQPQIDFFSGMNVQTNQPVVPPVVANSNINMGVNNNNSDFNTMRYMFATGQNTGNNLNQQISFNTTSSPTKTQNQNPQTWNTQTGNQQVNLNMNMNFNTNTKPVQPQINANNFSTLQGLFATNSMGMNQPTVTNTFNTSSIQQPVVAQQPIVNQQSTANFSLNTQHFATQGIPTQQGFGTSFNLNTQQFGTQNFMGQGLGSTQFNFTAQQPKTTVQQPVIKVETPVIQQQQSPQINMSDFNSMQLLFQTGNVSQQQQSTTIQTPVISGNIQQKSNDSFSQQFATMGGSSVQSPNTMFMNTYGGSGNGNLSFDMSLNGSQQQFNTSAVNPSMMKKKPSNTPVVNQTSSNAGDLI